MFRMTVCFIFLIVLISQAAGRDFMLGTCVKWNSLRSERAYRDIVLDHFSVIVPEYEFKMYWVLPEPHITNYKNADSLVEFAMRNEKNFRGHAFVMIGESRSPKWFHEGDWEKKDMENVLKTHIYRTADRFKGKVFAWDVVNEVFKRDGSLRSNVFTRVLGKNFIRKIYRWAHAADPDTKLFYNDYGICKSGPKSDAVYRMAHDFRKDNIPLHGIGFQMHLYVGGPKNNIPDFSDVAATIRKYANLGMEIHFTEVDVSLHGEVTQEKLEYQGHIYAELMRVFLAHKNCSAFLVWGLTDKYTWIPGHTDGQYGAPCIFDSLYRPKPAFDSLMNVIDNFGENPPEAVLCGVNHTGLQYEIKNTSYAPGFGFRIESLDGNQHSESGYVYGSMLHLRVPVGGCYKVDIWPVHNDGGRMGVSFTDTVIAIHPLPW
ncbi:MAG: endo-1,4-beta-xylanase [Chitinispirillaceae bacterium]